MREENDLSTGTSRRRLTPGDVQQQQFKRAFRGYDEQEVDDFLDRVTADIGSLHEEIEQLKEEARRAPTTRLGGAGDASDTSRAVAEIKRKAEEDAEDIVREARLRADAIVRDAEFRGGAGSGAPPAAASSGDSNLSRFVMGERSFLQELAGLIQSHAEAVKSMVQEARGRQEAARPSGAEDDVARERSPEPFGPPGDSAGRDIDASDEAAAATAGTALPDEVADLDLMPRQDESPTDGDDAGQEESERAGSPSGPAIIEVPEAAEDRATHESMWAEPGGVWKSRIQEPAGAPIASGSTADDREDEPSRRSDRGGESESSLGDLFWGEE